MKKLADIDLNTFPESENNVKHNIVVPFLKAFGHTEMAFEHAAQGSRIDINIGNRIIVETKALGKNLDDHLQQLNNYCVRESPDMAILTNGRQFRIYSPLWRGKPREFSEKIIFQFELSDLRDDGLSDKLSRILDVRNIENEAYLDNLHNREKEIGSLKREMQEIKAEKQGEADRMEGEIESKQHKILELEGEISQLQKLVKDVREDRIPEIDDKLSAAYLPTRRPRWNADKNPTPSPMERPKSKGEEKTPVFAKNNGKSSIDDEKSAFANWMKLNTELTNSSINGYSSEIVGISADLKEKSIMSDDSLYLISDPEKLKEMQKRWSEVPEFQLQNKTNHSLPSSAFKKYIEYRSYT